MNGVPSFAAGRVLDGMVPPKLTIDGVGRIAFPLLETQAQQLITRCTGMRTKHAFNCPVINYGVPPAILQRLRMG